MGWLGERRDSGRRAESPGQQARGIGWALLLGGLVLLVIGTVARAAEADLRDLSTLRVVEAQIVDVDTRRRAPDLFEVAYQVDGRPVQARVPYSGSARVGDRLAVAHVASDPGRVRPVEGWRPGYRRAFTLAAVLLPVGVVLSVLGQVSRRRRGRFEGEGALAPPVEDAGLGTRVVRSSRTVPVVLSALLLAFALTPLLVAGQGRADRRTLVLVAVGFLLLMLGLLAVLLWQHARDGVWSTPAALVARRRSHVRRWPWDQVRELGIVLEKGRASAAAARVDDGLDDGIGADEWVTLARPLLGPVSSHEFARRFRALAEERGLPLAEDVHQLDLADTGLGRLARRGPGSWARR